MSAQLITQVRPEIRSVLGRLRRRIRRYVFLEGIALVLVVLALLFWTSLGLDWAYFQIRTLELPVWFRKTFAVATICLFVLSFTVWVAVRVSRTMRMKALALLLEHRFPELDDRLITAVELKESTTGKETPLTASMLARTLEDVARSAGNLEVDAVFDKAPLRRAVVMAAVLVASIGGFAWANQEAMNRWTRAYLHWDDEYWARDTTLVAKIVAQPGDRIREFKNFEYKHPRGGDLTVYVEVPKQKPDGTPWVVPDRVDLYYKLDQGRGSGRARCQPINDDQLLEQEGAAAIFKYSVGGLLDGMQFWIKGGDYTNRLPYRVEVVDPPRIDEITLKCDYPAYTALNDEYGRTNLRVQGTQVSLPMETRFLMRAVGNKQLTGVRVQFGNHELAIGCAPVASEAAGNGGGHPWATLTRLSEQGTAEKAVPLADDVAGKLLSPDRLSFTLPLVLSDGQTDAARQRAAVPMKGFGTPLRIAADSLIRIYLEDTDEITNADPARVTVNGIIDSPPVVETELRGIGTSITRKAVIPVVGMIADDFGIEKGRFDFRIDEAPDWRPRPFRKPPKPYVTGSKLVRSKDGKEIEQETFAFPKDFKLQRSEGEAFEYFQVLPLEMTIGQKLTLSVFAADADNLNGPNTSRGERYVFKIVSTEELLAILYGRELNLRRRFEQIIGEVEGTQKDILAHKTRVAEAGRLRGEKPQPGEERKREEAIRVIDVAVAACAERSLHQVRKNAGENRSIEESFKEILEELVNNAVHTRLMVDRIDALIVEPLHHINEVDFDRVDKALGRYRLANEKGKDPTTHIDDSVDAIELMLEHMRKVLAEIKDLAEFHEAIAELETMINKQQGLKDDTAMRRKKEIIDKLKGAVPGNDDRDDDDGKQDN